MARTKQTNTTSTTSRTFEKGAFYEDPQGKIWTCTNGRTRKMPDGYEVVMMRATSQGKPTGEAGRPSWNKRKRCHGSGLKDRNCILERNRRNHDQEESYLWSIPTRAAHGEEAQAA